MSDSGKSSAIGSPPPQSMVTWPWTALETKSVCRTDARSGLRHARVGRSDLRAQRWCHSTPFSGVVNTAIELVKPFVGQQVGE